MGVENFMSRVPSAVPPRGAAMLQRFLDALGVKDMRKQALVGPASPEDGQVYMARIAAAAEKSSKGFDDMPLSVSAAASAGRGQQPCCWIWCWH